MVEGACLESMYTVTPYRGFESLSLRHSFVAGLSLLDFRGVTPLPSRTLQLISLSMPPRWIFLRPLA